MIIRRATSWLTPPVYSVNCFAISPRTEFAFLVKKHGAERHAKGFACWDQFIAMLFRHLARADSPREICGGLSCCLGKLAHLGVGRAPKKSTLSFANEHRPAVLYEALFWTAMSFGIPVG